MLAFARDGADGDLVEQAAHQRGQLGRVDAGGTVIGLFLITRQEFRRRAPLRPGP